MITKNAEENIIYLKPLEILITRKPSMVKTILGSCVSITMFSSELGIGGICHSILPTCPKEESCTDPCEEMFRYVDCTILYMLNQFQELGAVLKEIQVKLFGGAKMLEANSGNGSSYNIGKENVLSAFRTFNSKGLQVATSDIGGLIGRKILFNTSNGIVLLQRLDDIWYVNQ